MQYAPTLPAGEGDTKADNAAQGMD
jgi:hypothetical protein